MSDKTVVKMEAGDTFRVRRYNDTNWILEILKPGELNPFTKEMGKPRWITFGYYGQLRDVARYLLNQSILFNDGTSGKQIMDAIRRAENEITESLEKTFDV